MYLPRIWDSVHFANIGHVSFIFVPNVGKRDPLQWDRLRLVSYETASGFSFVPTIRLLTSINFHLQPTDTLRLLCARQAVCLRV